MKLRRLTRLSELADFIPFLKALHEQLEGKWEPELNTEEFIDALLESFVGGAWLYGDFIGGDLAYFVAITQESKVKIHFWLFYMNPAFRAETKDLLNELKDYAKSQGIKTCYTQSTRTASSYERWLEKFGAKKVAITYKFDL